MLNYTFLTVSTFQTSDIDLLSPKLKLNILNHPSTTIFINCVIHARSTLAEI